MSELWEIQTVPPTWPKNTLPTTSPHDLRQKTPPPGPTADSTKLSATPILKKESTSQMFSSMHEARDKRITAMSNEISGRIVGPVKVEDFLSQYLPKAPNPCPKITASTLEKHKSFNESKSEFAMYKPWINFMTPFCPNLDLVDAHDTPAVDFGGKRVNSDIQIYSGNCKRSGLSDMTQTEMTVEFKKAVVDDPFDDNGPFPTLHVIHWVRLHYMRRHAKLHSSGHMSSLSSFFPIMLDSCAGIGVAVWDWVRAQ
ncbi:hypothetical protein BU17DRAFT_83853 [Hysterangium stoloniferum]|nr:hypothetical protein BU17DRAFT_83853 [Hysterangium stoloniferum]